MEFKFSSEMTDLKKTYQLMKTKGAIERETFLDSVVRYCEFLGFNHEKTMLFLGLVRNVCPSPGQKWDELDDLDDIDIEYNKKMHKKI